MDGQARPTPSGEQAGEAFLPPRRDEAELLHWIERAHGAEAKVSALLADMAAAAAAIVDAHPARARDLLMSGIVEEARVGMAALIDVAAERRRQVDVEGWTPEKDDDRAARGELALAGAAYALSAAEGSGAAAAGVVDPADAWPFPGGFRPEGKSRRRRVVIAAALLLAAVEAEDRAMIQRSTDGDAEPAAAPTRRGPSRP